MSAAPIISAPSVSYHLRRVRLRGVERIIGKDSVVAEINCARVGAWKGHPAGEFEITRELMDEAIANFTEPVPLTYDHPMPSGERPIEKAGWVHALQRRGDRLYATCEFGARAVELNRAGSYKRCSIVFSASSIDRESGDDIGMEIYEIGLTDSPFISDLEPIHLSRRHARTQGETDMAKIVACGLDVKAIAEALMELGDDATPEQLHALVEAKILEQQAIAGEGAAAPPEEPDAAMAAEPDAMACEPGNEKELSDAAAAGATAAADAPARSPEDNPPPESPAENELAAVLGVLKEASGLDEASLLASLREKATEVAALLTGTGPSPGDASDMVGMSRAARLIEKRLAAVVAELDALKAARAAEDAAKRGAEADAAVAALVADGRLLEADKAEWRALALEAPARFAALEKTLRPAVPTGRMTGPGTGQRAQAVTESDADGDPFVSSLRRGLEGMGIKGAAQARHIEAALARRDRAGTA